MAVSAVLAFDFGGSKTSMAVADVYGRRLNDATVLTQPERGARWNFDQAVTAAQELLARAAYQVRPHDLEVVAVGACTFGIPTEDGVLLAPAIPGWEGVALRRELAEALQCPAVRVGTDVKAAAEAEIRSGALAGADPAIYLNLGTGLAVAIVCGGHVVAGANGAAGEIGYNLRSVGDLSQAPQGHACLEDVVSGMALAATASRVTGTNVTAAQVFQLEASNDNLKATLDEFGRELAFQLVNLTIALNPSRVAVGGGIVRSWQRIEPQLRRALHDFVPFPPELVPAAYPDDAALVGAIALGVDEAHEVRSFAHPDIVIAQAISNHPGARPSSRTGR